MTQIENSLEQNSLSRSSFLILVMAVTIAGFSQGMLLPVLATLLEREGVSSAFNGLSAASLYLGMLVISPFLEKPIRKWGYKPIILFGMVLVTISVGLFPFWMNFYFWIILRFVVGLGDTALHYATQLWITSNVTAEKRGRSITLYGLSYAIGFAIGPLGLMLLKINDWFPFIITVILFLLAFFPISSLTNITPKEMEAQNQHNRYISVFAVAGIAMMPFFIFGFLESSLNSIVPLYGYRTGLSFSTISLLLFSFVIGSLVLQLPLGILSDHIGRKLVLTITTWIGGILFLLIPTITHEIGLYIIFAMAGGFVGSLYSLGLANIADILQPSLLPTANMIATILFGIGSMIGPYSGGLVMDLGQPSNLFYLIGVIVLLFALLSLIQLVHIREFNKRAQANFIKK